jgi:hypothetical protein
MPLIPIDPQLVAHFNRSIMRLLRPAHLRDENYVTDFYCAVIYHPTDATQWPLLDLPDTETVPVHVEADGAELANMLNAFVTGKGLTREEADGLMGMIPHLRGQQVRMADMIPDSWQQYIMDRATVEALGYFGGEADARVLEQFAAGLQSMGERTDRRIRDGDG